MRVLFISRAKAGGGVSPIIKNQGDSLMLKGVDVSYYLIKGEGSFAYIKAIFKLFKLRKKYNIFHAHYSLSGVVATFSSCKPIIVSLMGSEAHSSAFIKLIIWFLSKRRWNKTIVKSNDMAERLCLSRSFVLPNGVDMERFLPYNRILAQRKLGWDSANIHILFGSDPSRVEKNFFLAKQAIDMLEYNNIKIHYLMGIPNDKLFLYYSACNVLLLTSLWEGSPNVIKEGMACNSVIVATDVGDIKMLFGDKKGLFIAELKPESVANAIGRAILFCEPSEGRKRILELGLSSILVASNLIKLYSSIIPSNKNAN